MRDINIELPKNIVRVIKDFPTRNSDLLSNRSYCRYINAFLSTATHFLEIGYRKGIFVEICKEYGLSSVHVDITDKQLKAKPTPKNRCVTSDSISFLKTVTERFDVIFQDGSKEYKTRQKEYRLIKDRGILLDKGIIIVDDLHYGGCKRAFDEVKEAFDSWNIVKAYGKHRNIGFLQS